MRTKLTLLFTTICLLISLAGFADDIKSGESTFKSYCSSCHRLGSVLTGPDLVDVDKRRSLAWITQFVQSSQTVISKGDKDAVALFAKFNGIAMPDHPGLSATDIKNMVEYIKKESVSLPKDVAPFATPAIARVNYIPLAPDDYGIIGFFLALVLTLIGVLFFAVTVQTVHAANEEKEIL